MRNPRLELTAFTLVEVVLAIGIVSFSLLAIFGLLTTGLQVNQAAFEQSAAADELALVANDLRSTPAANSSSPLLNVAIPSGGGTGTSTLYFDSQGAWSPSLTPTSRFRITISFVANGGGIHTASFANLKASWPAPADPLAPSTNSAAMFIALDRN